MQYQPFELTPRGVLGGLLVTPGTGLQVKVAPGVYSLGTPDFKEVKTETALAVPAGATTAIYANPDGTISLTPEADVAPGYVRMGGVDKAEDRNKGRSIKIAEVTLAGGAVSVLQADISIKVRFQFDGQRTNFTGLHNSNLNTAF